MLVYIINIFLIPVLSIFINSINVKNKRKICTIIFGIQLFLIAGFRDYTVGEDLTNYINGFSAIKEMGWKRVLGLISYKNSFSNIIFAGTNRWEIGYYLLNLVVSLFGNARLLILVTTGIITYFISKFIYRYSDDIGLSFYIFCTMGFYAQSMNILRQFIATVLILESIQFVEERKLKKFVLLVISAFFFHRTAIIFLLFYPLTYLKINKKYIGSLFISSLLVLTFGKNIFSVLNSISQKIFSSGLLTMQFKMNNMIVLILIISVCILIFNKSYRKKPDDVIYHMWFLSVPFAVLGLYNDTFSRIGLYFLVNMVIVVPNTFKSIRKNNFYIISKFLLYIILFAFYIYLLKSNANGVVPFKISFS